MAAALVFVSAATDDRVLGFRLDPQSGELTALDPPAVAVAGGPAALAASPDGRHIYVSARREPALVTLRVGAGGGLTEVGRVPVDADACHITTDRAGRFLLMACNGGGKVSAYALAADGTVGALASELPTAEGAHMIRVDAANRFALAPHKMDTNVIWQVRFDAASGALTPNQPANVAQPDGTGPRHFVWDRSGANVFVSNESSSGVSAYAYDPATGTLQHRQTLSTLPDGFAAENTTAQIHLTPDGRWLYVANRGHDSLARFAVDTATGTLRATGHTPTEREPRTFGIDATGRFVFVAGLETRQLAGYRIDGATGELRPMASYATGRQAMWVLHVAAGAAAG